MSQQRQLAAILFTDIEGYTALMQRDERQAVAWIQHYDTALNAHVPHFQGRILNNYGDGSLCSFPGVTQALDCAMALQQELKQEPVVPLRVGIHIGELFMEGDKVLGDAVNLASRIQSLGVGNSILFSKEVYDKIRNRPDLNPVSLGSFHFKNVQYPMEVFALSNQGLVVPRQKSMEGKLRKEKAGLSRWIILSSVIFLLGIGIFFYWHWLRKSGFTGKDKSIAVLPFVNMSGSRENEYFSDGMTDDIITQLYKVTSLRVISRTSTMTYKGSNKTIEKIADELHVSAILEGGIQRIGDRVRINVQLIDTRSGGHIWAEIYDRGIQDLFAIQTEVARLIAEQLNVELTDKEKDKIAESPTRNLEAWNQYQQGRFYWNKRNDSSIRRAIGFFNAAIGLDPRYARAYSGLADCWAALGYGSYIAPSEAFLKAQNYADSAMQLDSSLAEPHASKGYVEFYYYWRWPKAESEFREAIRLNPQYDVAFDFYAYFLTAMERFPEAQANLERAQQLAPLSAVYATDMGFSLYYDKKYERATENLKQALDFNNKGILAHLWLARVFQAEKNYPASIAEYEKALEINKTWVPSLAGIGYVYASMGKPEEARKILKKLMDMTATQYVTPYGVALIYASLHDMGKAYEWLDKAVYDRSHWLVWLKLDPRWDPIRSDKRYEPLLARIGLPKTTVGAGAR